MPEPLPDFVRRRRSSWETLASLVARLGHGRLTLDELSELDRLYRRAASDLALSRTFYQGSDAEAFLNQLCARAYAGLYQRRPSVSRSLVRFVQNDFPGAFVAERRFFFASLALVAAGASVGAIAAAAEPASVRGLVPQSVLEHLERGTLWTDTALAASPPLLLGTTITVNNLAVALTTFGLGITFGLGTAAMLLFNGLHVGAVVVLCAQAQLGTRMLGFMVAHGFVELSAILIAGQAGLMLGAAIVDPGDLSRGDALRLAGRRAVRLVLGTLPLFAVVGMVEGFVSPGDLFPDGMKLLLGVCLCALLFLYLFRFGRAAVLDEDA
jgi:uncharacterized membrane protein SpoIIM required for sporulation